MAVDSTQFPDTTQSSLPTPCGHTSCNTSAIRAINAPYAGPTGSPGATASTLPASNPLGMGSGDTSGAVDDNEYYLSDSDHPAHAVTLKSGTSLV